MTGVRVPDVLVATLAGLGVVTVVDTLAVPFTVMAVRAGAPDLNVVVQLLVSVASAALGSAVAVVVHELRLAPRTAGGPARWLLVGLPTVLVLAVLALVATVAWGSFASVLPVLAAQALAVLVGAGAALAAGAVVGSRSVSRTLPEPPAAAH